MNRTLTLIAAMLLLLSSCNGSNKAQTKQAQTATQQQQKKGDHKMNVKELTLDEFKKKVMNTDLHPDTWVFEGERPALIDFYAPWCGPCKMTAPRVEQIAEKYSGKIDVYKVDVDKEQELAAMFGIQSIPSLLFIPMKGQPQMSVGAMSLADLDSAVVSLLK